MATDRQRADEDLAAKMRFEAELAPILRRMNVTLVREFVLELTRTGTVLNVEQRFGSELSDVLVNHYFLTSQFFSQRTRADLPEDVEIIRPESDQIEIFLALIFASRSETQARVINQNTQKQAERSIAVARMEQERTLREEERVMSNVEVATVAGAFLTRNLKSRELGIVTLETQAAAEIAKAAEFAVLDGRSPTGAGATQAVKEWVTQGDDRVRLHHLQADSQQVAANLPFTVKNQKLMVPGDTSLGATPDNVVNCRCSAVYDVESVISSRQDL